MIYFLVNNNYHLYDVNLLYQDLKSEDLGLIQIPHTLNVVKDDPRFVKNYHFPKLTGILKEYRSNKSKFRDIEEQIHIINEDILLVYTEYEIVNQFIIELFYNKGAKVYLLEDGMATQHIFNLDSKRLKLKTKLKESFLKIAYNLKNVRLLYDGWTVFPITNDFFFNGAFLYFDIQTKRNISIAKIKNNTKKISLKSDTILFLNQDLYNEYESFSSYLKTLNIILEQLFKSFEHVYFKFHPREKNHPNYSKIEKVVKDKGCCIIEENDAIEKIIDRYTPSHSISYFSASIKNLAFMGIEPIFIYHLFPKYNQLLGSQNLTSFLTSIGYNFILNLKDINPSYKSTIVKHTENEISIDKYLMEPNENKG